MATKSAHAIHKNLFEADSNRSGTIMAQNCSVWLCNYRCRPETQINLRAHLLPYLPLQIWTLKICNHDISKTITARSSILVS